MIEKVTANQVNLLREISISTFRDTYEGKNDPINFNEHITNAFNLSQLLSEINSCDSFFYFVKDGNEILGYIKLNKAEAQTEPMESNYMELERIYVVADQKGKGIGRKLINLVIQKGKELKFQKLWLGVWDQNPEAIKFYEHMGFTKTGTHIFTIGDEAQTDYVMELDIQ